MCPLSILCAVLAQLAAAQPPQIEGLTRRAVVLDTLPRGDATLQLDNPHVARSTLVIGTIEIGQVPPRGSVTLRGLPAGPWQVTWITPAGFARRGEAIATAPSPARSSRSSSR